MSGPKVLWCADHDRPGGTTNCLICACVELNAAISQIDYLLGPPNEMRVSDYDLHADPAVVVERLRQRLNDKT